MDKVIGYIYHNLSKSRTYRIGKAKDIVYIVSTSSPTSTLLKCFPNHASFVKKYLKV